LSISALSLSVGEDLFVLASEFF